MQEEGIWEKSISHTSPLFSGSASNSFPKHSPEHKLTGAHRLTWILFNIQRCSLILLGISLEIPAKQRNSTTTQHLNELAVCNGPFRTLPYNSSCSFFLVILRSAPRKPVWQNTQLNNPGSYVSDDSLGSRSA